MNSPEIGVLLWLFSGVAAAYLAYIWAGRLFELKDFVTWIVLGPLFLLAWAVLIVGVLWVSRGEASFLKP